PTGCGAGRAGWKTSTFWRTSATASASFRARPFADWPTAPAGRSRTPSRSSAPSLSSTSRVVRRGGRWSWWRGIEGESLGREGRHADPGARVGRCAGPGPRPGAGRLQEEISRGAGGRKEPFDAQPLGRRPRAGGRPARRPGAGEQEPDAEPRAIL